MEEPPEVQSGGMPVDLAKTGAILSDTLQFGSNDDTNPEPWLAFLPYVSEDVMGPIFSLFIKRAAIVMSSIDFTVPYLPPLPDNMSLIHESAPLKLATASNALLKLYNDGCDSRKRSFLEVVGADRVFVYNAIKLACKVLQLYGDPTTLYWQGPATGFIGLIVWSLDSNKGFRIELKELGLLTTIVSHLSLVPFEAIHDMSENKTITQMVWLLFRILFNCTIWSNTAVHLHCSHSQALRPFLKVPDVELRLITKALFTCWSLTGDCLLLEDVEVLRLRQMLTTDLVVPFSFHGLSFEALFAMIRHLAKVPQNALLFLEKDIQSVIADLSERLLGDEQEMAMELLWFLMQIDGDAISRDTMNNRDCIKPGSKAEQSHQQEIDNLCYEVLEASSQDEAAVDFTEFLLRYLIRTLLPYEYLPLEDGFSQLPESTWFSISTSIMLIALLLKESSDQIQAEIVQSVLALRGASKALHLAVEIGLTIKDEGLPRSVMSTVMRDLLLISMTWTDQSCVLAQEMSQLGFVHTMTMYLHAGCYVNTFDQNVMRYVLHSLFTLLNCAYNPSNHPAFRFAETIPALIPYADSSNFDVSSTAKFTLSCLHQQLDCDQLLTLVLTDEEAEYCVTILAKSIESPSFKADGFAVHELLEILINLTHSYSAMKEFVSLLSLSKNMQKRQETGSFDQRMLKATDNLERNSPLLMNYGLLNVIEKVIKVEKFQKAAATLLWNLTHHESIKAVLKSDFPIIIETLKSQCKSSSTSDHQLVIHCCLWQLGDTKLDHMNDARYAQGCYELKGYFESVLVCSNVLETLSDSQEQLKYEMILLKGKASFHIYQRKLWHVMENRSTMSKAEEKRLIEECFNCIKETINLLGTALDKLHLDNEGSQLLDWAMMDCIRETNKLNQCDRCLLCRQYGEGLCKSHIFPKFILKNAPLSQASSPPSSPVDKSEGYNLDSSKEMLATIESRVSGIKKSSEKVNIKPFLFGLDKHQMKSAGECWLWMCCKKCEERMSQNAENYFSKLFPTHGKIQYSSWLFSYCCTILFRSLSCVKFPRTVNDEEVYRSFLFCRMHLLSLPIKFGMQDSTTCMSDVVKYQLKQLSQMTFQELKPYLLITPPDIMFKSENVPDVSTPMIAIPWLAPHRLADGRKDLAGRSHYFVAYCNGVSILLKFLPSCNYQLPESCCISPQCGTYIVPNKGEIVEKIPPGLWVLHHRSSIKGVRDVTEAFRQMGIRTAEKMASTTKFYQILDEIAMVAPEQQSSATPTTEKSELSSSIVNTLSIEGSDTSIQKGPPIVQAAKDDTLPKVQLYHSNKPQLSLLPPEFKVTQPLPNSQIDKCIKLPHGHQIVLHSVEETNQLSCFIAVGSDHPDQPYVIFLYNKGNAAYIDGAFIETVDKEIHLIQFLLDHAMYAEMREQFKAVHQGIKDLLTLLLKGSGFMTLKVFIHFLKCHQLIRGSDDLPSLDTKCSPEGCWYCKDLCHCCLKPAHPWSKGENVQEIPYRFCSKKCMGLLCFHPSKMPQSMFVIDHRDEFKSGKFKGCSVLDILYVNRKEGKKYNTVEFIHLCLGDGSEDLPLREPYILWQFRDVDSQFFLNFHTTVECIPLGPLWPSLLGENDDVVALQEASLKLEPKLASTINTAVQALGCESVQAYLSVFNN